MNSENGFVYTERAYDIIEFGIKLGHDIRRPKDKPLRLQLSFASDEDMDKIINGDYNEE